MGNLKTPPAKQLVQIYRANEWSVRLTIQMSLGLTYELFSSAAKYARLETSYLRLYSTLQIAQ